VKSVELFVGAGGLALGIGNAGFVPEAVVEWNHHACETIRLNQRNGLDLVKAWPLHEMDVAHLDYTTFSSNVELVSGGPPCQPFSLGGKHQGYNDKRDMFPQAIRAVRELQPSCFIFENVKGLTRRAFTNYLEYIRLQLTYPEVTRDAGEGWQDHLGRLERHYSQGGSKGLQFKVMMELLNAANYGVPQHRERLFIVGFRNDLNICWSFPTPTHSKDSLLWDQWITGEYWDRHKVLMRDRPSLSVVLKKRVETIKRTGKPAELPWRTVRDALIGLPDPELELSRSAHFANHEFRPGARSYSGHTGSPLDEPSKTLKAGDHGVPGGENMLVRTDGSFRYYTVRESARLQTFPDDYVFQGSWSEAMRQLGNAVPVLLSEKVAGSVSLALQGISNFTLH
jgi:DNA (cytosine-5)-methyltransferase 1